MQGRRKLTGLFCISSWLAPYIPDHADIGSYSQSMQPEATITTTSHNSLSSSNSGWHKRQANTSPDADADALSHAPAVDSALAGVMSRVYKRAAEDMPRLMLVAIFGKEEVARNLQYVCGTRATLVDVDAHLARWLASPGACYPSNHRRAPVKGDNHRCCQGALCAW